MNEDRWDYKSKKTRTRSPILKKTLKKLHRPEIARSYTEQFQPPKV